MTITARTTTARIPLDHPRSLLVRLASAWSRRRYGEVLEPGLAMLHHRRVLVSVLRFEKGVEKWATVDPDLKDLATAAVSAQIGCSWCMDFGYYLARDRGMDRAKLEAIPAWRSSEVYSPLERKVLGYAEAMTATPPEVTDEMVAGLREDLTDEQLVELTEMISVENLRSRTNSALGLTSQGFKDHCEVPAR
jgi:AhpD family alkylhydroperoxidase